MTPVTIRLCEVMELNPVPILMSMVIYSNIGGALTPVGDPPNVIIASNSHIAGAGVNFTVFTMHMAIGVILVMIQTYFQLRLKFKNINDLRFSEPQDVQELRHEIAVWQRAAASLSSYSKDEDLVRETLLKKVQRLSRMLKKKLLSGSVPIESYRTTLEDLQAKVIKQEFWGWWMVEFNWLLLMFLVSDQESSPLGEIWCCVGICGCILLLALSTWAATSLPRLDRVIGGDLVAYPRRSWGHGSCTGPCWVVHTAVLCCPVYSHGGEKGFNNCNNNPTTFNRTIFLKSLSELGLIDWIGKQTENIILSVNEESRLAVAILLILWVSAIASAFVDNIPLTTMMVKITISLAENEALGLPIQPLVWALAFGACLGGKIDSILISNALDHFKWSWFQETEHWSALLRTWSVREWPSSTVTGLHSWNTLSKLHYFYHNYWLFIGFTLCFRVGFPVMIGSIIVATAYLMVAHVLFTWH